MQAIEYQRMFAAEEKHWWYAGLHDLTLRWVRAEAENFGRPLDLLDAGCGTGRLCQLLEPLGAVSGCDIHPLALKATAGRGINRVWRGDVSRDDLGTDCFDVITAMDVLYHRDVLDEASALWNFHAALRGDGLLLLQVPAFHLLRGAHDEAVHTRRRYWCSEIVRVVRSTGFAIEFASYRLPWLFFPALLWRIGSRLLPRRMCDGGIRSDVTSPPPFPVNGLLTAVIKMENTLLTAGLRFPIGTSIFVAARKPMPCIGHLSMAAR